ncbi:hypothetical protein B0H17DRAFT_1211647 [Mycena rosella]|uniref:DUF21-domain-containing protein n=1 Tax=Mycena rosella TaxID=1033263 RepID=A0AAD7CU75_MYCRO|nr:hypothetical protein B0H17DRAFT_1211647 [Mycena rosella]
MQLQTVKVVYEHPSKLGSTEFWEKIGISMLLVLAGGLFAGLTLGLMGLDELHLRVLASSSKDPNEQRNAEKVLALMEKGRHWVLVVLLLCNVIINESLPIFLDSAIGGGIAAIGLSTTAIVIFGEYVFLARFNVTWYLVPVFTLVPRRIIPQALSVRYGLSIGAACAPLVLFLMYLFSPIAYPIAKLLDSSSGRTGPTQPLLEDEISILNGVLELNTKHVEEIMTPIKDVMALSADAILDDTLMETMLMSGYSRFPVHDPDDPEAFVGLLLIKKLLRYDPALALPVGSFPLSILPEAHPRINCFQALDYFQTGRAHLILISNTPGKSGGAIGVITLEDIIEEILSEEIVDETDRYTDNVTKRSAKRLTTASVMLGYVSVPLFSVSPPLFFSLLFERRRRRGISAFSGSTGERTPLITRTPSLQSINWAAYGTTNVDILA